VKGSAVPSDRSDAGIRLLGYAAARRRNLLADEAQRPRRVAPRPSGLLPRSLPAVVSSRRVLPIQRGDFTPEGHRSDPSWAVPDVDRHSDFARETAGRDTAVARNRPLISELSDAELAREAVASLREPATRDHNEDLTPVLLDLGSGSAGRPLTRVPSGRHRNRRGRRNIRTGWIGVAAATLIAQEAGAIVSDHLGNPYGFNAIDSLKPSLICAGAPLFDEIIRRCAHLETL